MMLASTVQINYMCGKNSNSLKPTSSPCFDFIENLKNSGFSGGEGGEWADATVSGQHPKSFARRGMMIIMVSKFLLQNQLAFVFACC